MATEMLYVPEENLQEVIMVIRAGLNEVAVSDEVAEGLESWCESEEEYLLRLQEE